MHRHKHRWEDDIIMGHRDVGFGTCGLDASGLG